MRRLITAAHFIVSLALLATGLGFAQTAEDSWDNLMQLRVGQKIEVVDMKMKSLRGTFVSLSEEGIAVQTGNGQETVERGNVLRVTLREHPKRLRNALRGAVIGAVALGVPVTILAPRADISGSQTAAAIGLGFAIGAGAGAGIGAAVPSYATIYRAVKKP